MNENLSDRASTIKIASGDVFVAARWLADLWNSSAKAVSSDEIEWQCNTWGSGRGCGDWLDTAKFAVVSEAFGLRTWRDYDGRDELVVAVPLAKFPAVATLIQRLGEEPEAWPWLDEDLYGDTERQISTAAEELGLSRAALAANTDLLDALRIE